MAGPVADAQNYMNSVCRSQPGPTPGGDHAQKSDGRIRTERTKAQVGNRARVLVVDDDSTSRHVLSLILTALGYHVDTAEDGEAGWTAFQARHYDLLVTDHNMPELTGLDLVLRLRETGERVPVIVVSGSPVIGQAEDHPCLALSAIFHKPFNFSRLAEAAVRLVPTGCGGPAAGAHRLDPAGESAALIPLAGSLS